MRPQERDNLEDPLDLLRAAVALLVLGLLACGTPAGGSELPNVVADVAEDTASSKPDVPSEPDVPGAPDVPEPDIPVEPTYPDGPFGTAKGEIIDDLGFYDPVGETTVWLHQWYQDAKVRLLMIISTAGW